MDNKNNKNGNINRYTNNIGHDTAKNRLSNKLKNSGFDIYELRKQLLKHPIIKDLINKKAVYISKITGQNFWLGCKNQLLSDFRKLKFDNGQIVVQIVNNISDRILADMGFKGYGKTKFWESNNPKKYPYPDRIYFGADYLTLDFINGYSQEMNKNLNDKQKMVKYRPVK